MSDFSVKVCPICKKKFNEDDLVKVCSVCKFSYHQDCWNENKGCFTVGCSERYHEPQCMNNTINCSSCGTMLKDTDSFCQNCGSVKDAVNSNVCGKCGLKLEKDQVYCHKCGQKRDIILEDDIVLTNNQFNDDLVQKQKKNKLVPLIITAVIVLFALGVFFFPTFFISVESLLENGEYQKAYNAASAEEKKFVFKENVIAYLSKVSADALTDQSAFELQRAWYDYEKEEAALLIAGKNSFGAIITNFWYFRYDEDENEYSLYVTLDDLKEEEERSWHEMEDILEIMLINAAKDRVSQIIDEDTYELSKEGVNNINNLFKEGKLGEIVLIDKD